MSAARQLGAMLAVVALSVTACTAPAEAPSTGSTSLGSTPLGSTSPSAAPLPARITDVNCDGVPDVVVGTVTAVAGDGAPWRAGSVAVRYGGGRGLVQVVDQLALGDKPAEAGGRFGGSVVAGDLNLDGCSDVVVGDAESDMGAPVWVLWGSPEGISASRSTLLLSGDPALGYQLAFVPLPSPVLVVGSDEGPRLYPVQADGTLGAYRLLVVQSPTKRGSASHDSFGDVLSASGDLLVVGAPEYSDEGYGYPGEVWVVRLLPGLDHRETRVAQDSAEMPDSYELDDGFGESVSLFHGYLAIGAPGIDHPGAAGSGQVQVPGDRVNRCATGDAPHHNRRAQRGRPRHPAQELLRPQRRGLPTL